MMSDGLDPVKSRMRGVIWKPPVSSEGLQPVDYRHADMIQADPKLLMPWLVSAEFMSSR